MLSEQELIFSNEQAIVIILNLMILLFLGIILIINLKKCNKCNNEKDFSLFDWLINQTKSLLQRRKKMKQNKLYVYTKKTLHEVSDKSDKTKKQYKWYSETQELIFTSTITHENIVYSPKIFDEKEYNLKDKYHFVYDTLYYAFNFEQLSYDFNDSKINKLLKKYTRKRIYQSIINQNEYIDIIYRDGIIIGYEFSKRSKKTDATDYFYFIDEKIKNKVMKELKIPLSVVCKVFDKDVSFINVETILTKEDYKKKMKKMILEN